MKCPECPSCRWRCHPEMVAKMTVGGTMHCNFYELKKGKAKPRPPTKKRIEIHREAWKKGYLEGQRAMAEYLTHEAKMYVELETDKQMDELRRSLGGDEPDA